MSAKFHEGQYRCLITTVAYGMGIDIDDVTLVIHWGEVVQFWPCGRRLVELEEEGKNHKQ